MEGIVINTENIKYKEILVFLVRHGETPYNEHLTGRVFAKKEGDLTKKGRQQILSAAEKILKQINPSNDLVWVISSPRIRAIHSAKIIKKFFRKNNIVLFNDQKEKAPKKKHETQHRVLNTKTLDEGGKPIETDDERHGKLFAKSYHKAGEGIKKNPGMDALEFVRQNPEDFPEMEPLYSVEQRSDRQLEYFVKIAHLIQPKIEKIFGKRLIIIEVEHIETLEKIYRTASNQEFTIRKNTGAKKGEVVELIIPVDKKAGSIGVSFLDREKSGKINKKI